MISGYSFDNGYEFGYVRVVKEDGDFRVIMTKYIRPHCTKTVIRCGVFPTKKSALKSAQSLAEMKQRKRL